MQGSVVEGIDQGEVDVVGRYGHGIEVEAEDVVEESGMVDWDGVGSGNVGPSHMEKRTVRFVSDRRGYEHFLVVDLPRRTIEQETVLQGQR